MSNTVTIVEKIVVVDHTRKGSITVQDKNTVVEVGNKEIQVVAVGQVGPTGIQGTQGIPGADGSGINAEQIQTQQVAASTPNENDVLVSHAGTWTPEPLNGGYF